MVVETVIETVRVFQTNNNNNATNAQRPADAGRFHKTIEYKQASRHNVFQSAILHNIEMSLRCKIGSKVLRIIVA